MKAGRATDSQSRSTSSSIESLNAGRTLVHFTSAWLGRWRGRCCASPDSRMEAKPSRESTNQYGLEGGRRSRPTNPSPPKRSRTFARRRVKTLRPPAVAMRARKPDVLGSNGTRGRQRPRHAKSGDVPKGGMASCPQRPAVCSDLVARSRNGTLPRRRGPPPTTGKHVKKSAGLVTSHEHASFRRACTPCPSFCWPPPPGHSCPSGAASARRRGWRTFLGGARCQTWQRRGTGGKMIDIRRIRGNQLGAGSGRALRRRGREHSRTRRVK